MAAVRLKDVAARANVSIKTVSNVVNGYVHVSETVRTRVEHAISELGYRPNLSARNLRSARAGVLALAVPELTEYFAELASLIQRAAEEQGFTLIIDQTGGSASREQQILDGIRGHLVDGLIFSPIGLKAKNIASRTDTTPLVLLGERVYGGIADHVAIDNVAAASELVDHLVGLGKSRIAAIGATPTPGLSPARFRIEGYRRALKKAGLEVDPELIVRVERWNRQDGADAVRQLLVDKVPFDAVFALNDWLAIGALHALHEARITVPDEVAIVGFDDLEAGRFLEPELTTIAPDKNQIALQAVTQLTARLSKVDAPPQEILIPYRLIVRQSSAGRVPA